MAVEIAIRNGQPREVEGLLARMSDEDAIEQLTSTYGRGKDKPDDYGLYEGTTPILHAARSGNPEVFSSVIHAMRARLSAYQVNNILEKTDHGGRSLLAMAVCGGSEDMIKQALEVLLENGGVEVIEPIVGRCNREAKVHTRQGSVDVKKILTRDDARGQSLLSLAATSGSKAAFKTMLGVLDEEVEEDEVLGMLKMKSFRGRPLLGTTALCGNTDMFETVLAANRERLQREQMKQIELAQDDYNNSLLALAVLSKSADMFNAALACVEEDLTPQEVETLLTRRRFRGRWLLAEAALGGDIATFEAVLNAVRTRLRPEKLKEMELLHDDDNTSLLTFAVLSKSAIMFAGAMACVDNDLTPQEVEALLTQRRFKERWLLAEAALVGEIDTYGAVLNAVRTRLRPEKVKAMVLSHNDNSTSLLAFAILSKSAAMFVKVMASVEQDLSPAEVGILLTLRNSKGRLLLAEAATVDKATFKAVLTAVRTRLEPNQVKQMEMSQDNNGRSLFALAILSKNAAAFEAAFACVQQDLAPREVESLLIRRGYRGRSLLEEAAFGGDKATFEVVLKAVSSKLRRDEVCTQLAPKDVDLVGTVIKMFDASICTYVLTMFQENMADKKVARALDCQFEAWNIRDREAHGREDPEAIKESEAIFSCLLHHSARPTSEFLQQHARDTKDSTTHGWQRFVELVIRVVESARNPLVPGMNLSVALAKAADRAREGETMKLSSLRGRLDAFMLGVLERLPQTVRGFKQRVRGCSGLFDPEESRINPNERPGPLRAAFERRQHIEDLCAIPLVMDYLSSRFTCDLPDLGDMDGVLQNKEELRLLAYAYDDPTGPSLYINDSEKYGEIWDLFQGIPWRDGLPALTVLPGAQFIIAGLLLKPRSYYRVPAMRMAMDFVVYVAILAAYTNYVLLHEDGPVKLGEILFTLYILAGAYTEWEELRQDFHTYAQDRWNYLDALGLMLLLAGGIIRLVDSSSPWGRALYALSAPPVFSRVLFFAQVLRFQGPMVQALFSMAVVLAQFGVILLVVMMGFAASFYSLFRNVDTFGVTLLSLFKTSLGDVGFFDELDDIAREQYAEVGRLLLIIFVVFVTIMLLNLLVAILSTTHADVHLNAEREFKVCRARTVQHYRLVVELDILPAPFNVLQLLLSLLPFIATGQQLGTLCRYIKRTVGEVVFWLMLSPLALIAGTVLWIASTLKIISILHDNMRTESLKVRLAACFCMLSGCIVGIPVCLVAVWLMEPFMWTKRGLAFLCGKTPTASVSEAIDQGYMDFDLQGMLAKAGNDARRSPDYTKHLITDLNLQFDGISQSAAIEGTQLGRIHRKVPGKDRLDRLHEVVLSSERKISTLEDEMKEKLAKIVDLLEKTQRPV